MAEVVVNHEGEAALAALFRQHTAEMGQRGEGRIQRNIVAAGRLGVPPKMVNATDSFPDPTNPDRYIVGVFGEDYYDFQERGTRERREDDAYPAAGPAVVSVDPHNRGVPAAHFVRDAAYTPEL